MQRDVKIGIAIGVLLIALIGIFWWARSNKKTQPPPTPTDTAALLPASPEPVAPPVATPGSPEVTIPGAPKPVTPTTLAGTTPTTINAAVTPLPPGAPTTTLAGAAVPPPIGATPTPPPAAAERKYTVVANDSLAKIAKQFYGDENKYKAIAEANKIAAPYNLKPGQVLVIPEVAGSHVTPRPTTPGATPASTAKAPTTAPRGTATTHKVVAGDTLSKLAKHYYGSEGKWKTIYEANKTKMSSPDDVKVGTELVIPADK